MHRLLERQLRRHLGKDFQPEAAIQSFLDVVDSYYHEVDREQQLLQNAVSMNTAELNAVNERLRLQNAEMTRTLLNTLSDGVYATDLQGRLTFMNAAAERILGWQEQELMGRAMHEMVQCHASDDASFRTENSPQLRVIGSREAIDGSGYFAGRDDRLIPVEYRSRPIMQEGKLAGMLVSFQDVTERKKNEQFIRLTQERLNLALDGSDLALWDWDIANDRLYLGSRWSLMMGGQQEETLLSLGQFFERISPQDQRRVRNELGPVLKGQGEFYSVEFRIRRNDGSWAWVHTHGKVMERDATGRATRMTGTNADITERKQSEEALHKSETKLRTLYDSTSDAVMLLDGTGFIDCNMATLQMFGCTSREAFCSMHPGDLSPGMQPGGMDSTALANQQIRIAMESGSNRFEWVHQRMDNGKTFDAEVLLNAMTLDGKRILQATVRDITERKLAEEALREAKKAAEEASRAKSDFLANMSHEIRTPMNGIIGMTELALDTELNGEQREYLELVKTSADALLDIVNDILDFSKIEAGKMDIDAIDFNLQDMLSQTTRSIALRAHQKGLELLLDIAPDIPEILVGDPGRLRQVVVNLVGNAIKFTEAGEIVVKVELDETSPEPGQAKLHISVRDTGIGIPANKLQAIFGSFTQADTSTTRRYGGTGLGLAISTQLAALMRGRIWVESEVGRGSTFHVEIALGRSDRPDKPVYEDGKLDGMRVLVVDDNATNRKLVLELLSGWKMKPQAVASGRQAITELERAHQRGEDYRLVLLDAQMPDMDGFEVAGHLKAHPELPVTPIMMLNSEGQRGDGVRCRELGISAYLLKPFAHSDLFDAIRNTLGLAGIEDAPLTTRSPIQQNNRGLRVLLAEDNAVNQALAVRLLNKFGHGVDVAGNGLETVEKWANGDYDLILMDVDMPQLNGYGATARIREQERRTGKRIPIIGLTAHVMKGSREECLAAGMDGYLSKPIDTEALWIELEALKSTSPNPATPEMAGIRAGQNTDPSSGFELGKALALMDDDMNLFREMVRIFLDDYPGYLEKLGAAIEAGDAENIRYLSHTLKGQLAIFAVSGVASIAERIETTPGGDYRRDYAELAEGLGGLAVELKKAADNAA